MESDTTHSGLDFLQFTAFCASFCVSSCCAQSNFSGILFSICLFEKPLECPAVKLGVWTWQLEVVWPPFKCFCRSTCTGATDTSMLLLLHFPLPCEAALISEIYRFYCLRLYWRKLTAGTASGSFAAKAHHNRSLSCSLAANVGGFFGSTNPGVSKLGPSLARSWV